MFRAAFTLFVLLLLNFSAVAQNAQLPSVVVNKVLLSELNPPFQNVGRVEAIDKVELKSRVSGYLLEKHFSAGQKVEVGQLLFSIEPTSYNIAVTQRQADLASANASLENAKATYKRRKELRRKGVASGAELDQAKADEKVAAANVMQAKAALENAKLDLSYTQITSPIEGIVSRELSSRGNLISANTETLATVTRMDRVYVTMAVSEKDMLEARREGIDLKKPPVQPTLILSDGSEYDESGEFDYIDTEVSASTDTILIRAVFPNPGSILLPGEFVQVHVRAKKALQALTVPQSAVQKDQQGYFVLVVDGESKVEKRPVQLGLQQEGRWVVISGLQEGEQVIIAGLQKVRPDMAVSVVVE